MDALNELIEKFLLANGLSTNDLRQYCNEVGQEISLIWGIDDVHQANKTLSHRVLSDEEALLILGNVECDHDAGQGISWDTLVFEIRHYFETEGVL
jgi:hypothetical protein